MTEGMVIRDQHGTIIKWDEQDIITVRKKLAEVPAFKANVRLTVHTVYGGVQVAEVGDYIIDDFVEGIHVVDGEIFKHTFEEL